MRRKANAHCKHILFFANAQKANAEKNKKSLQSSTQDKIELKKISSPSENKKHAIAQPNARQKTVARQTPKPLTGKRFNYSVDRRPACNSGFKKLAVQWLNKVKFFNQTFVICAG